MVTAFHERITMEVNRHIICRTRAAAHAATSSPSNSFVNMKVEDCASSFGHQSELSASGSTASARQRTYLCCEVRLKDGSVLHPVEVRQQVHAWLMSSSFAVTLGKQDPQQIPNPILRESCAEISIEPIVPGQLGYLTTNQPSSLILPAGAQRQPLQVSPVVIPLVDVSVQIVAYRLHRHVVEAEVAGNNEEPAGTPSFQRWTLPHEDLHGLWDTLHFDSDTKKNLLQYATTAMLFSDRHIDSKLITWNRILLLHGPPGTGKSSLCKALAHKLSVRLSSRYNSGHLIEVNAHSLFSRWFSESGKLVVKLFTTVKEMLEDNHCFVCVLVDEVESVSAARSVASSGNDPSDALRVVNALLTQLDTLRSYPNALVLTTSNLTEKIDPAFLDRADLKQYIPNPNRQCRYEILKECLEELMKNNLLKPHVALYPFEAAVHLAQNHQGRHLAHLLHPHVLLNEQLQTACDEGDAQKQTNVPSLLQYLERLCAAAQAEGLGQDFGAPASQRSDRSDGTN